MNFTFGKYKDKPVAWVLLSNPDYFKWMKKEGITDKKEYQFALELLQTLEAKPFSGARCSGGCKGANIPTRLSLYQGRNNMDMWFCDSCDPYECGAILGKLSTISRFNEFVNCGSQKNGLIKTYCKAKGVPSKKTSSSLEAYFGY